MIDPQKQVAAAIINGEFVRAGDTVAGAKVISVNRQGVEVEREDQIEVLEIRERKQALGRTGREPAKRGPFL